MKFYTISGLGADKRVFDYLEINHPTHHLEWIEPNKHETLPQYAQRLSGNIDTSEPFGIIGVSFGGMLATEIAKQLNPKITVLISSVSESKHLPFLYRFIGSSGILKIIPSTLFNPPNFLMDYYFGTYQKKLLYSILSDTDTKFTKWCVIALTTWQNETVPESIYHIHGTKDKVLPLKKSSDVVTIDKGTHFMIVDRAKEISSIINHRVETVLN